MKLIASNAGVNGSVVMQKVIDSNDPDYGYNAATDKFEDLMDSGIIDPTKVCRAVAARSFCCRGRGGWVAGRCLGAARARLPHPAVRRSPPLPRSLAARPRQVIRCALENASSVAKIFLLADVVVTDIPEKNAAPAGVDQEYGY